MFVRVFMSMVMGRLSDRWGSAIWQRGKGGLESVLWVWWGLVGVLILAAVSGILPHTHTQNGTQREADSWHPKSEDKLFNSNTRHVMLVVGEKGGGGKSTQRILFYFLNLNTHHIVLTPSLCRNPTGENLLCQCTAQVSLY